MPSELFRYFAQRHLLLLLGEILHFVSVENGAPSEQLRVTCRALQNLIIAKRPRAHKRIEYRQTVVFHHKGFCLVTHCFQLSGAQRRVLGEYIYKYI